MELIKDKMYHVVVSKIVSSGIIVTLDDTSTEHIHKSKISTRFVDNISDFVSIGDEFDALCIEGKVSPLELSLKHLGLISKVACNSSNSSKDVKLSDPNQSLTDMINKANAAYLDKFGKDAFRFKGTIRRKK